MPWYVPLIAALIVAGCTVPLTSSTSGAGGGDAGSTCVQTNGCQNCTACALAGPCAAFQTACDQDSSCQGIDQCYGTCGGVATCQQQCQADNPDGVTDYTNLTNCVDCTECATACGLCSS